MNIKFSKLEITDFQGINKLNVDFSDTHTKIVGTNGVGKSTILDAILWCLTGMNQRNQSDSAGKGFKILPLDIDNNVRVDSNTSVKLTITIGNKDFDFQRKKVISFEKNEDGSVDLTVGMGTKTDFFINGTSLTKGQYNAKLVELIGNEDTIKLLMNVSHFLENTLEKDQRSALLSYIKEITHEDMCGLDSQFALLTDLEELPFEQVLNSVRTNYNDLKKEVESSRSVKMGMLGSLALINLDETVDYVAKEVQREKLKVELKTMRNDNSKALTDVTELSEFKTSKKILENTLETFESNFKEKTQNKIITLKEKIGEAEEATVVRGLNRETFLKEYNQIKLQLENSKSEVEEQVASMIARETAISERTLTAEITRIDNEMQSINVEKQRFIDEVDAITCSLCGQELPEETLSSLALKRSDGLTLVETKLAACELEKTNLIEATAIDLKNTINSINKDKGAAIAKKETFYQTQLDANKTKGMANNGVKKKHESSITDFELDIIALEKATPPIEDKKDIEVKIIALDTSIQAFGDVKVHTTEELENIEELISELSEQLSSKDNYAAIKVGIDNQDSDIRQKVIALSNLEQKKLLLEEYLKVKNNMLSQSLKEYFNDDITFKFLEFTQDGTPKDVFKLLVKGVDYSNANTGAKIIAGIQMIQFFQEKQDLFLPILIDNTEAIVIDLPAIKGQIVTCSAVRNKKLTIGGE